MRKSIVAAQKFISNHRVLLASGLTAAAFLALMWKNAREVESFMDKHGLKDEYLNWLTDSE